MQLYQGPYQSYLPVSGGDPDAAYHQIQGAHIYKLNAQRQPLTGCTFGPGTPCRAELTAP